MSELTREEYLAKRKAYYNANKSKISQQNSKRYFNNTGIFKERKKRYTENNKNKIDESNKKYREKTKHIQPIRAKLSREKKGDEYNRLQRERRKNLTPDQKQHYYEYRKKYREKNKEKILEYQKSRIEKRRELKRVWHHKKYRSDPQYKIRHNLRSRMKTALNGTMKNKTSMQLLGCEILFFKDYIESKFTEGMSWEMLLSGKIHLDHIKPCAKFDLTKEEEQRSCFHYTNLQPLWALDNLKKSAKYQEV